MPLARLHPCGKPSSRSIASLLSPFSRLTLTPANSATLNICKTVESGVEVSPGSPPPQSEGTGDSSEAYSALWRYLCHLAIWEQIVATQKLWTIKNRLNLPSPCSSSCLLQSPIQIIQKLWCTWNMNVLLWPSTLLRSSPQLFRERLQTTNWSTGCRSPSSQLPVKQKKWGIYIISYSTSGRWPKSGIPRNLKNHLSSLALASLSSSSLRSSSSLSSVSSGVSTLSSTSTKDRLLWWVFSIWKKYSS